MYSAIRASSVVIVKHYFFLALLTTTLVHVLLAANEMIPFVIPWDDNSENITNLSDTLHAPAGKYGYVTVSDEGHYWLNDKRIRFYGVNIGAASIFPPQEKAPAIAERLARMGMNVARLHHMDNGWTESLIDYSTGGSRTFDADNLDRMDKLIAELKRVGIYTNINLLCSRIFYGQDGLHPDVEDMHWKETHILGFFDEGARNLQKELAQNLLEHVNPYTGLSYAEDPAIAFIEVNNENGLFHQWHTGTMERMPEHYQMIMQEQWNAWLQTQYASTTELEAAWGAVNEPLGAQLLTAGNFTGDISAWNLENHQGAQASLTTGNFFSGNPAARININQSGTAAWHVQFNQGGLQVSDNQVYTLSFWIRSSQPRDLSLTIMQAYNPWQGLGFQTNLQTTDEWQRFETSLMLTRSDTNARLNFGNMGLQTGIIEIANVELRPGGSLGGIPQGTSLESGNIPLVSSEGSTLGKTREDWMRFMRELEYDYWADMDAWIKALGYEGLTWGTTIMNSPPSAQAIYTSIDSHSYWQHPNFQGNDWNPVNWTVDNESMVNDDEGGVIPTLSWQRIAGMPHNVTEYQHSSPNTYSSEGPLFVAAYASLQDWDGIYLFHYGSDQDNWDRNYFDGFFDIDHHPSKLVNAALGSLMFRRFDIQSAQQSYDIPFSAETELEMLVNEGAQWNVGDARHLDISYHLPLTSKVGMVLDSEVINPETGEAAPAELPPFPEVPDAPENRLIRSDTGELLWDRSLDAAGFVHLDTPQAKGIWGFQSGRTWDFGNLQFRADNTIQNWCTFVAVFIEGEGFGALSQGGRGIIAVTGNTENTGMGWTDATRTSVGDQWGSAPVLIENISATAQFAVAPANLRVWSLDVRGNRQSELPVIASPLGASVNLGGETGSLWYEFEILPH